MMSNNEKLKIVLHLTLFLSFMGIDRRCSAQNRVIDSLLTLIKENNTDTNKVIQYNAICWENLNAGNYDTALYFGNQALKYALKLDEHPHTSEVNEKYKKYIAYTYNAIGAAYYYKGSYSSALEFWLRALKVDEEIDDKKGMSSRLGNIGTIFYDQGNLTKALEYYFKGLTIARELKNKGIQVSCLGNIALVYSDQLKFDKALEYNLAALELDKEIDDKQAQANALGNIGIIYARLAEQTNDAFKENTLCNKASEYFFNALKMAENIGNKTSITSILSNLGELYIKTGKYKEAEKLLKKSIAISDSIGELYHLEGSQRALSRLYDTVALLCFKKGQWKQAAENYKLSGFFNKKAIGIKDSLFTIENKKLLLQKEIKYEFEKKESELKAENEKKQAVADAKSKDQQIIIWSVSTGLLLLLLFTIYILRSLKTTNLQKQIIEKKNETLEQQGKIIERKNKDILDSIHYAKRIQNALLGEEEPVTKHLPEHFILFLPKDIVSGDFYWGAEKTLPSPNGEGLGVRYWYFAVADCTGHGVPGAIMSMLGISFINEIVLSEKILSPSEILNHLRDKVIKELRQTDESVENKDGMDISLCRLNLKTFELQWAGANNSLNLIRNGELEKVKADKQPIGYHPESKSFTNHEIQLQPGDSVYIYSDGYTDQFGGPKEKKFGYKKLENLFMIHNHKPMKEQKDLFRKRFIEWKGPIEQTDDVCVLGIRV